MTQIGLMYEQEKIEYGNQRALEEKIKITKKFMENLVISPSYYEQPDPYANAPSCHVNLLELSRYAKQCGKKLVELTQEEVKKFSI